MSDSETVNKTDDHDLIAKMQRDQQARAAQRRQSIEAQFDNGELGDEHFRVGLNAFHQICDRWAIDQKMASALLQESRSTQATTDLLERFSCFFRIFRLLEDVVQGDDERKQHWLRRAMPAFEGKRPIDLMASGPKGSAVVMEYLEHAQQAQFH